MRKKKEATSQTATKAVRSVPSVAVPAPVVVPSVKQPKAKAPKAPKQTITIDFPVEREIVTSAEYCFRISTTAVQGVQVSIDGKDWQPARESVGFWWYDWSGYGAGPHTVEARIPSGKRFLKSKPRQFTAI